MSLPELQQNPLVQRVIDIFDTDQNGEVDFKGKRSFVVWTTFRMVFAFSWLFVCERPTLTGLFLSPEFIQGVSQFSVRGDKESKLKCASIVEIRMSLNLD